MIKEISYKGWAHNLLLTGQEIELVVTLDIGPRVIRYGKPGGKNVFVEFPEQIGQSGESDWKIRGGHRFWTAPEGDHSYELDNTPVTWQALGDSAVEITQPAGKFGFQKTLRVEILPGDLVRVTHLLTNTGASALNVYPWALTVMAPGGFAVIPQPRLDVHPSEFPATRKVQASDFWPNRDVVLWPFTNLTDGRYEYSRDFLRVWHHPEKPATKIGLKLPTGWVAYQNEGQIFAKYLTREPSVPYPDNGVNFELFTNPAILEVESLAPAVALAPGAAYAHTEHWVLKQDVNLRGETAALDFFASLPKI